MKMQEILDIASQGNPLPKITQSTAIGRCGRHEVQLPFTVDGFEHIDSDEAIRIIGGALHYLKALIGDDVINKYHIPYTTEDTEYIKHYLIGDVPVEIVKYCYPGTLMGTCSLLVSYNDTDSRFNTIKVIKETMNIADRIRLFNYILNDYCADKVMKEHNNDTIMDLIIYFQNIAEVSEIDNDVNYIALIREDTDPTEFAKYTIHKTNRLSNNIKALLLSDVADGKVIKIEEQEK